MGVPCAFLADVFFHVCSLCPLFYMLLTARTFVAALRAIPLVARCTIIHTGQVNRPSSRREMCMSVVGFPLQRYEIFMRNARNAKGTLEAVDPSRRMPGSLHDRGAGRGIIPNPF